MNLQPPITVVNTVCWSAGEVLLGKRQNADAAGTWCTPGGKADAPGFLSVHACRELWEEVGIALTPAELVPLPVWTQYTAEDGQVFTCVYYATREPIMRSLVQLREPEKFECWSMWSPRGLPRNMFDGDRRAVHAAAAYVMLS